MSAGSQAELAGLGSDAALLDIAFGDPSFHDVAALIGRSPSLACLRLPVAADQQSIADRILFDAGFVRIHDRHDPWPMRGRRTYLRSDLVTDVGQLGEPTGGVVSMASLGANGRFANQIFQWAFLKLYGLRTNCRVQAGYWIGNALYGARAETVIPKLSRQAFTDFHGIERALWYLDEPPVDTDFHGFFQEIPPIYRRHKRLFQLLFRPHAVFTDPIDAWLAAHIPAGATKIGIHIRRGDYLIYDHARMPWFRPIPVEWYRAWLAGLWPTVERPVLILASDEPAVASEFRDFGPIVLPAAELAENPLQFLPDFHALCGCDLLTVINSSFSRVAGLLARDGQRCYLPNLQTGVFEPYDPWADSDFWARFGA